MVTVLTVVVQVLVIAFLLLLNVRIAQAVVYAWRDARDERKASDLMPHLIKAHAVIRGMKQKLVPLKREAARIGRYLWPY